MIALIITGIMRGQMKTVRMKPDAADYMVNGSLQITRSNDVFLYHQVTKTAKPKMMIPAAAAAYIPVLRGRLMEAQEVHSDMVMLLEQTLI